MSSIPHPILVVDDEPAILRLCRSFLSREGLSILPAPSAQAALATIEKTGGKISLLLTDIHMNGLGGGELAKSIVKAFPTIPVLFMSSSGATAEELVRELPGSHFLKKPFSQSSFRTAVKAAMTA